MPTISDAALPDSAFAFTLLPMNAPQHAFPPSDLLSAPTLTCTDEGTFRIVQFNDTQDDHLTDRRTLQLMEAVLDRELPQLVVINGDIIDGGPNTAREVRQAINNVVQPMESRGTSWAVTFGNHEEDSNDTAGTGMRRPEMLDFVRQYPRNVNPAPIDGVHGFRAVYPRACLRPVNPDAARL